MKSVLISIRPKWCEKIMSGEKTIEVRKSAPKEVPFKCYIYCTKTNNKWALSDYEGAYQNSKGEVVNAQCKVIGEFICDEIDKIVPDCQFGYLDYLALCDTCLSIEEIQNYGKGKTLYGWHISDLKIYDKPKELNEFYVYKHDNFNYCYGCVNQVCLVTEHPCCECLRDEKQRAYLKHPPQSWQYVEEVEE